MKKTLIHTYLLCGISFLLFATNPLHSDAANTNKYMPHIDAFTFAVQTHTDLPEANEYTSMIIADVNNFVNVRTEPNTESGIVGRLYDGAVAKIIKYSPVDDAWIEIESGEVIGYVKAEFFLAGEAAADAIEEKIQSGDDLIYARSMNEILAEIAAQEEARRKQAQEEAERLAAQAASKASTTTEPNTASGDATTTAAVNYTTSTELRQSIVDFALQYVGNPYVHGGNSLTKGTDCSGFTSLIYAEFGYSLSRTPSGQLSSNGTKIEYSEIQPGDIICYTSNGKTCTHVAIYIGDGQIVHAANSKKGIIIGEADYSTIMGVKNIVD